MEDSNHQTMEDSNHQNLLTSVLQKLFSYLFLQKKHLMTMNFISTEMEDAFQELLVEFNQFVFVQLNGNLHSSIADKAGGSDDCTNLHEDVHNNKPIELCQDEVISPEAKRKRITGNCDSVIKLNNKKQRFRCLECKETFLTALRLQDHIEDIHCNLESDKNESGGSIEITTVPITMAIKNENDQNNCTGEPEDDADEELFTSLNFAEESSKNDEYVEEYANNLTMANCPVGESDKPLCKYCCESFPSVSGLKRHLLLHSGNRNYTCYLCSKNYTTFSILRNHVKNVHQNIRPYECEVCKKRFSSMSSVKEHMVVHTGNKPYQCDNCGICFGQRSSRSKHRKKCLGANASDTLLTLSNETSSFSV